MLVLLPLLIVLDQAQIMAAKMVPLLLLLLPKMKIWKNFILHNRTILMMMMLMLMRLIS